MRWLNLKVLVDQMLTYFEISKLPQKLHGYYERKLQESVKRGDIRDDALGDAQVSHSTLIPL